MNPDPDYSAAYVVLTTDDPDGLEGHGLTFTIGRGNELCVAAIHALMPMVIGLTLEDLHTAFFRNSVKSISVTVYHNGKLCGVTVPA